MKTISIVITLIILGLFTNCKKGDNTSSVSGEISYTGLYTGQNKTIYIRAYTTNINAIGTPDYATSIFGSGSYTMDLNGYKGDLYMSAFMDIDNTGNTGGPTANEILIDGVLADPSGCYGDYTFESGAPGKITVDGAGTGINFELQDNGVIKARFSDTGHCVLGVIKNHIINEGILHHIHCDVTSADDKFLLPVPVKDSWYCKVKFDNLSSAQLYPDPINIRVNTISEINF